MTDQVLRDALAAASFERYADAVCAEWDTLRACEGSAHGMRLGEAAFARLMLSPALLPGGGPRVAIVGCDRLQA